MAGTSKAMEKRTDWINYPHAKELTLKYLICWNRFDLERNCFTQT